MENLIVKILFSITEGFTRMFFNSGKYLKEDYIEWVLSKHISTNDIFEIAKLSLSNGESIEDTVDSWLMRRVERWYFKDELIGAPLPILNKIASRIKPVIIEKSGKIKNQIAVDFINSVDTKPSEEECCKSSGRSDNSNVPVAAPIIIA